MNIPELATPAAIYALAEFDEMQDFITEDLERFATAALQAALPHLEAALRKQIAVVICVEAERMPDRVTQEEVDGMNRAARIAEEGNTK